MRTSYGTPLKWRPDTNHAFFSKLLGIHGLRTEALIATAVSGPTSQCGMTITSRRQVAIDLPQCSGVSLHGIARKRSGKQPGQQLPATRPLVENSS